MIDRKGAGGGGAALAAALLLAAVASPAGGEERSRGRNRREPREERGAKGGIPEELATRIDAAIARGNAWLKDALTRELAAARALDTGGTVPDVATQEGNGSTMLHTDKCCAGRSALYAHALVVTGTPPSDPTIQETWAYLRDRPMRNTYDVAMTLLLRESMVHPPDPPQSARERPAREGRAPRAGGNSDADWVRRAADWLCSGCDGGTWNYFCPGGTDGYPIGEPEPTGYEISGTRDAPSFGQRLEEILGNQTAVRTDLSNTQYAVLGLKAASLLGVKPENHRTLWRVVVAQFLRLQETTGPEVRLQMVDEDSSIPSYSVGFDVDRARGWGYMGRGPARPNAYASMTTCGLATMLIAQSEVPDMSPEEQGLILQSVRDGLAWFQTNWSVTENLHAQGQIPAQAHYYFLYGLERVGVLANFRTLGGHNWYQEGAEHLLSAQGADGAWPRGSDMESEGVRTAFALLFLARGTSTEYVVGR